MGVTGVERVARLFFALWPDESMQADLGRAIAAAVRGETPIDGRLVPARNFHLTLAFLGSVPQSRFELLFEVVARCMRAIPAGGVPIAVTLDALEHWRKAQVLVATSRDTPPAAATLAEVLQRALAEQGFSPDLKPFRVHATVARKVRRVTRELRIEPVRWSFDSVHLVESRTDPAGSVYSTVQKWVLDKWD